MQGKTKQCPHCKSKDQTASKYNLKNFKIKHCRNCNNAFLFPSPSNIAKYYPETYWKIPGTLGIIKQKIYQVFQSRRIKWIKSRLKKNSLIADIGSGEAEFAKTLKDFNTTSIDFPGSKIKNPEVIKIDYLKWEPKNKFDAVVFWQSLEHVPSSVDYLKKTHQILKKGGLILIECPRFDSYESRLFTTNWYHLDPPRHLLHFTKPGLIKILKANNFKDIHISNVFSPEHVYPGFLISLANSLGLNPLESYLKRKLRWQSLILLLLSPIAFISASILQLFNNSPIMLAVARKS